MIKITLTSGPRAGTTVVADGDIIRNPRMQVEPMELFHSLIKNDWNWEINAAQATDQEVFLWGRAHLASRIQRALSKGIPILVFGARFNPDPSNMVELERTAGVIEDTIVDSGQMVTIGQDDDSTLSIIAVGDDPGDTMTEA